MSGGASLDMDEFIDVAAGDAAIFEGLSLDRTGWRQSISSSEGSFGKVKATAC